MVGVVVGVSRCGLFLSVVDMCVVNVMFSVGGSVSLFECSVLLIRW